MEPNRAESIFLRAIEFGARADRDAWVASQCAGNPELARSVSSLLEAFEASGDFLATRAVAASLRRPPNTLPSAAQPTDPRLPSVSTRQMEGPPELATEPAASPIDSWLAALPAEARQEVRERILAALRLRALGSAPPAASPQAGGDEEPVPRVPGFRLDSRLGSGGLGVVYAAWDEKLARRVAIKVLRPRNASGDGLRHRVVDEARKAAALDDPAIVTIHSVIDDLDPPAIVMEYVEGFPIDRFAARLNFEQRARLLQEVARGLAAAHRRGLIHRDLKPENVIVGPEMRPRILDFGLALGLDEAQRLGRGFEGTPLYASPEQVRGEPLSPASDVFSFGSLMYKVLTGRPAFDGSTVGEVLEAIATTAPPFLREAAVGVPEDLQAIALACLSWNPADRPTAETLVVELGRFLAGEIVRLRPRLYGDLLRQRVTEYSAEITNWETQGIISRAERDQLQALHRRLLADEDHWIIDARRITVSQTVLYSSTWIVVVAAVLLVWLAPDDLPRWLRWLAPVTATACLLGMGIVAERRRETLAAASFLAGVVLSLVPTSLALLEQFGWFSSSPPGVTQLLGGAFSNQQVFVSCAGAFALSLLALRRLQLTGFAWTTAALGVASYLALLACRGWLDWPPYRQALGCLPLVAAEGAALAFERAGRVRWSMPYHGIALLTLVIAGDTIAMNGPTLTLLGVPTGGYFDATRLESFSLALNGLVFLALMILTERAPSLDLRRATTFLEILALVHVEGALFANAHEHRGDIHVKSDVLLHLASSLFFLALGAWRGRWRLLVGALAGLALGSYLLVDLGLLERTPFILGLGGTGLAVALAALIHLLLASRSRLSANRHRRTQVADPRTDQGRV